MPAHQLGGLSGTASSPTTVQHRGGHAPCRFVYLPTNRPQATLQSRIEINVGSRMDFVLVAMGRYP